MRILYLVDGRRCLMLIVKKVIVVIMVVIGKVFIDLFIGCCLFVFLCEFIGGKNCDDCRELLFYEVSVILLFLY